MVSPRSRRYKDCLPCMADAIVFRRPRALLIAEKPLFVSAIFDSAPPVVDRIGTLAPALTTQPDGRRTVEAI